MGEKNGGREDMHKITTIGSYSQAYIAQDEHRGPLRKESYLGREKKKRTQTKDTSWPVSALVFALSPK
jgi:hypothetical protein